MRVRFVLSVFLILAGCGDDGMAHDGGAADAGSRDAAPDIGDRVDGGPMDMGADIRLADAGAEDARPDSNPGGGFGTIDGMCGQLMGALRSAEPSLYSVHFDFMDDGFDDPEERPLLTADAALLLNSPNAGGSSQISEAFALETLVRCEGAHLLATENDIVYVPMESKKTDFLVEFGALPIGVSVVRAFTFPLGADYTVEQAAEHIGDKLDDILISTANVTEPAMWDKQILAILAFDTMPLASIRTAWESFSEERRANTILYVIITDGDDQPVYLNRR